MHRTDTLDSQKYFPVVKPAERKHTKLTHTDTHAHIRIYLWKFLSACYYPRIESVCFQFFSTLPRRLARLENNFFLRITPRSAERPSQVFRDNENLLSTASRSTSTAPFLTTGCASGSTTRRAFCSPIARDALSSPRALCRFDGRSAGIKPKCQDHGRNRG